jgi:hypothetical protein
MDEARTFVQGIQEKIEKCAKWIARKNKQIQFSPKVFQVVMKIWLWSPAAYKDLHKSGWIISLLSQQRLWDLCCDTMVDEGECISLYMPLGLPWIAWLQDWFSMAFSNAMKWNW